MSEGISQREQKLLEVSTKVLMELWKKRLDVIKKDYEAGRELYDQEIIGKMNDLLVRWQKEHGGRAGGYELQIALFDQNLYNEEDPLCLYWTPKFIFKDVEEDMAAYKKMAAKEIIRLREDEVYEIRRKYALCHAYVSMLYMDRITRRVFELPAWKETAGADTKVLYGTYMEQMMELGTAQEGEKR